MESNQVLKVCVDAFGLGRGIQIFYAKMNQRWAYLRSIADIIVGEGEELSLAGQVMEFTLKNV